MTKANGEIRIAHGPEFIEDWVSGKRDPLALPMEENFDFDALDRNVDEAMDGADDEHREKLVRAIRRVLEWTIAGVKLEPGADKLIGRRCLALLWTIGPESYLQNLSLSKVAVLLGLDKATLSKYSGEARRKFRVQNRFQSHAANFKPTPNASG
jgi:hypothetical protein